MIVAEGQGRHMGRSGGQSKGQKMKTRSSVWLMGVVLLVFLAACGGSTATPTPLAGAGVSPTVAATATTGRAASGTTATRAATAGATPALATAGTATRAAAPSGGTPTRAATPRATSYPLAIKDDAGRTVTLARRPQRIVSLAPSGTELLFALGLGDRVVGVDKFSNYPAAATSKPQIGSYAATNLEQVLTTEPDLILASGITKQDVIAAFESRGIATVVLDPPNIDGVLANITLLGQITDVAADAARVRGEMEARIAAINARLRGTTTRPRVFFELDATQFFTVGPKSFINDLIERAGGANIAADAATAYPKLSQEQIIAKDPEVIILSDEGYGVTVDSVKTRPGWVGIGAVKSGRIVGIDPDVANRPGPRVVDALERLVLIIHPELFR